MASNSTPNASGRGTQATTSDSEVKIDLVTMSAQEFQAVLEEEGLLQWAAGWRAAWQQMREQGWRKP